MPKSQRNSQIFVPGLGQHYTSLTKRPPRKPVRVQILGDESKKERLRAELARLMAPTPPPRLPSSDPHVASKSNEWIPLEHQKMDVSDSTPEPGDVSEKQYHTWKTLLLTLIDPLLKYEKSSMSKPLKHAPQEIRHACKNLTKLFYFGGHGLQLSKCCTTTRHTQPLPNCPLQPCMAISIDLLNFYHTLFEESCDAVHAMAQALHKFYLRHGYMLNNSRTSNEAKDPFCRSPGYVIQWHNSLHILADCGSLSEADDAAPSIINKAPVAIDKQDAPSMKKLKLARNCKCS
ncbi:hypothetical protein BDN71DRAFT_1435855 [Pleurotus eryngii]|uniref:Uncharacterized protein n=1 Tax=Pleurotus eryngii TaxID=5323 RepID=A0A9P5ZM44_PLEER|nr:hypothetical protein BDN71DRAFT_1435855 [Pleurotus eryngii]